MRTILRAATAVLFMALPGLALAAAPAELDPAKVVAPPPIDRFQLDTVMIVHNWVLCISAPSAERIARARDESADAAIAAYAELAASKACGKFKKLGVLLREPLYRSAPEADFEARVFGALVNIGVGWQSGFVVVGGVPE